MSKSKFDEERETVQREKEEQIAKVEATIAQIKAHAEIRLRMIDQAEQMMNAVAGAATPMPPPEKPANANEPEVKPAAKKNTKPKRKDPTLRTRIRNAIQRLDHDDFVQADLRLPGTVNVSSARKCLARMARDPEEKVWLKAKGKPYEAAIFTRKRPKPESAPQPEAKEVGRLPGPFPSGPPSEPVAHRLVARGATAHGR